MTLRSKLESIDQIARIISFELSEWFLDPAGLVKAELQGLKTLFGA